MSLKDRSVCILMATYNGELYLREQLRSIADQTHQNWRLLISDDGSTDATREILREFQLSMAEGKVITIDGPRRGFAANFMHLAMNDMAVGEMFAFCDQDDIWDRDKIERAVEAVSALPESTPVVYGTRTRLVDRSANFIGLSPTLRRSPGFRNALAQNVVGGNTIIFNKELLRILKTIGDINIVSHDWWVYLVVTAIGGVFLFDESPSLLYRQHGQNLVGHNATLAGKIRRVVMVLRGRYVSWMESNIALLFRVRDLDLMSIENRRVLEEFQRARHGWGIMRVVHLYASGVRRQTWLGNLGLAVSALLKRM